MDLTNLIGPALTIGGSFLSSNISRNRSEGLRADDKAYDQFSKYQNWQYNTAERLAVQQWEEEMWNKQNEYNSPENQLRLAMEAGINPNAIFGNGNSFEPASGLSVSPMSSPGSSFGGSSSGLASSMLMQDAQMLNAFASARKTMADADIAETQANFDKDSYEDRLKEVRGRALNLFKDIDVKDTNIKIQKDTFDYFARKSDIELEQMQKELTIIANEITLQGEKIETENILQEGYGLDNAGKALDNVSKDLNNQVTDLQLQFSKVTGIPLNADIYQSAYWLLKSGKLPELLNIINEARKGVTEVGKDILYEEIDGVVDGSLASSILEVFTMLFGDEAARTEIITERKRRSKRKKALEDR